MGIVQVEDATWLRAFLERHSPAPRVFVETGTGEGHLTRLAVDVFDVVHTIELSPVLVEKHYPELRALGAICWPGNSAAIVPQLAVMLQEPVFWYLDAHWWDADPPVAWSELPLLDELRAIAGRSYLDVIVVDDVNCFGHGPQPAWNDISLERIAAYFPTAREITVLGDQLAIYR